MMARERVMTVPSARSRDGACGSRARSGLVGLSDRIEALGGTLRIISTVGSGTTLLIEMPLESQSNAVSTQP
jgi:glucose-6-phosphate-specific signal transduction histidine kinase